MPETTPQTGTVWAVTFRRDRFIQDHRRETLSMVTEDDLPNTAVNHVRAVHPEAIIETVERKGEGIVG